MFSDRPHKNRIITQDQHDETQKEWEGRIKTFKEVLQELKMEWAEWKLKLIALEKTVNSISDEQKSCANNEEVKSMGEKLDKLVEQGVTNTIRLDKKKEKESEQNGKITKLDDKEDAAENRITILETKMIDMVDTQNAILSLLKAVAVGLVIFFFTFMFKTVILGI